MNYQVEFYRAASKQFKKLPLNIQKRVQAKIEELAMDPRPIMECNNLRLLQEWILKWRGSGVTFEIVPVVSSK